MSGHNKRAPPYPRTSGHRVRRGYCNEHGRYRPTRDENTDDIPALRPGERKRLSTKGARETYRCRSANEQRCRNRISNLPGGKVASAGDRCSSAIHWDHDAHRRRSEITSVLSRASPVLARTVIVPIIDPFARQNEKRYAVGRRNEKGGGLDRVSRLFDEPSFWRSLIGD